MSNLKLLHIKDVKNEIRYFILLKSNQIYHNQKNRLAILFLAKKIHKYYPLS